MPYFKLSRIEKEEPQITIKPFATATDAEITAMLDAVRAGDISVDDLGWQVGDTRTVHISSIPADMEGHNWFMDKYKEQDATFVILHGPDRFTLVGGKKNLFVIGLKNLLGGDTGTLDFSLDEDFVPSYEHGWSETGRRQWLNDFFKPALPTEVQKWFKEFYYESSDSNYGIITLSDYFTLPAMAEVYNGGFYKADFEGPQFDYYGLDDDNAIKHDGDSDDSGYANQYWTRTIDNTNENHFYCITETITMTTADMSIDNNGFAPFGCV